MVELALLLCSLQTILTDTLTGRPGRMYGFAVIDLAVDEDGSPSVQLAYGTNPLLVGAARRAAERWRFTTAHGEGLRCATLLFQFAFEGARDRLRSS